MKPTPSFLARGAFLVGLAVVVALLWASGARTPTLNPLHINRQKLGDDATAVAPATNVVPDWYEQKYSPVQRAKFHVTASQPMAIFVLATGVEVRTDSGWAPFSEERRNEIWRLKPGLAGEMFVERPQRATGLPWRAYVRYGTEMKGPRLWKWQLRAAWQDRSFTNWTGQAWGGGRFNNGGNELLSEEYSE